MNIEIYRMNADVRLPKWGTDYANCFDIEYCPVMDKVHGYDSYNVPFERWIAKDNEELVIFPGDRLLVPTGLVFVFPETEDCHQYSLRLHARSGLALKRGLVLANSTGIVDVDYRLQVFALLANVSGVTQTIAKHERICQGEIVKNEKISFVEVATKPEPMGNRAGGFGSTGTK
jgi:dUTP pyrophosphatase